MSTGELAGSLGMKATMEQLDMYLADQGVSKSTRDTIKNAAQMMYEYIPYAIKQKKDPTDGKVLAAFLHGKGMNSVKFLGNDGINCGIAIIEFLLSTKQAATATNTGFAPAITLAYGLALLDLIEVGNSCEFAQQAYYEAFLKKSDVKLKPIRTRVQQNYSADKRMCVMPEVKVRQL